MAILRQFWDLHFTNHNYSPLSTDHNEQFWIQNYSIIINYKFIIKYHWKTEFRVWSSDQSPTESDVELLPNDVVDDRVLADGGGAELLLPTDFAKGVNSGELKGARLPAVATGNRREEANGWEQKAHGWRSDCVNCEGLKAEGKSGIVENSKTEILI